MMTKEQWLTGYLISAEELLHKAEQRSLHDALTYQKIRCFKDAIWKMVEEREGYARDRYHGENIGVGRESGPASQEDRKSDA